MIGGLFRYFWDVRAFMDIFTFYGGGKGGGGGAAPAPDPNIGIAARQNADLAAAQYRDFQTNVWPEMKRQSQIQLDMSTKLGEQQYNINLKNADLADKYQKRMEDTFYPLQDKLVADAKAYNTNGNFERQAALAIGDVNTASDVANKNTAMQMRSFGINPNSGVYQGSMNANGVLQAATASAAATKARAAAEQLGWAKSMDAVSLGQGLPGNQATSTGIALTAGNSALQAGQTNIANTQALGSSYSQGYGGAMQGWNNVGNLGVQTYNGQLSAYNAQQQANAQSSAGWGSLAGSVVGAVGNYYSMGALGAATAARGK